MKLPIEKHIFELLKSHDCVIVGGFGGFILNHRSAYINRITNTIHPPSKKIGFNQKLSKNDDLLANYLAQIENISHEEACLEIMKFSRKANLKLQKGESIFFKNIGEVYASNQNQIRFKPIGSFNFNIDSYGLKEFPLSNKKSSSAQTNQKVMPVAAAIILFVFISIFSLTKNSFQDFAVFSLSPLKTDNYSPRLLAFPNDSLGKETPGIYHVQVSKVDPDLYKINGTDYHIATKRCFKEGFGRDVQVKIWIDEKNRTQRQVCFLNPNETEYNDCFKIVNVYNELSSNSNKIMVLMKNGKMKEAILVLEESYIDPYIIANTIPEEKNEEKNDTLLIKDIPNRFVEAIQTITTPEKTTTKQIKITPLENTSEPPPPPPNTKKFHIVIGSFSDEKNAQALSKQMKNRGFQGAQIIGTNQNGLIRVAVSSFYTEEEAKQALIDVKKKLSSGWILNENY